MLKTQPHVPVMVKEILTLFAPLKNRGPLRLFDGTLGRGGHLRALLREFCVEDGLAFDRDPQAIEEMAPVLAKEAQQIQLRHANYSDFAPSCGLFDLMLIDLGVSSPQLDQAERGFSFYHEGPLDMRMDPTQGQTAADILNSAAEDELMGLFTELGEIHRPGRVVRAIQQFRRERPFAKTLDFADLIVKTEGWRKKGVHPATNYFLALRLLVNRELECLQEALPRLRSGLKPGGRLAVLTFHSLEDRIVKYDFKGAVGMGRPVNKKVIVPEREEILANPRSRSAKLRVFERSMDESSGEPQAPH